MISLMVVACLHSDPSICQEWTIATSEQDSDLTMQACMRGQDIIADWANKNLAPRFFIRGWKCRLGTAEEREI